MKVVNVDLDGVIYPFHEIMADWLAELKRGRQCLFEEWKDWEDGRYRCWFDEPSTWEMWKEWGMSHGEWKNAFRRGVEYGYIWTEGTPIEGAQEYMWRLSDDGFDIRIVTYRLIHKFGHKKAVTSTTKWLDKWNIPYRSIAFIGAHDSKANYKAEIQIDDNPAYLKGEAKKFLLDRRWNRNVDLLDVTRVFGWKDFYERIA